MSRPHLAFLFSVLASCLSILRAQDPAQDAFRAEFNKGIELNDEKLVDKALKRAPYQALIYYEAIYWEKDRGIGDAGAKCVTLAASWKRCFENSETIDKFERWLSGMTSADHDQYTKRKYAASKLWRDYLEIVAKEQKKADHEKMFQQMMDVARSAEASGNNIEIADVWNFASVIASKIPEKTLANRRDGVFACEQFVNARKAWGFTFDEHYIRNAEFLKFEKVRIEEADKADEKRKGEGYDPNAKGVETLVMPNAVEAKHELKFEAMTTLDELDYGPKSGPVPPFWWMVSTEKPGSSRDLGWFARKKLYLLRTGASKFAIGFDAADKNAVEIDVSPKLKVSTFWLDAEKKQPHALAFWIGSDREMVNEAECNLSAGDTVANVYYRSASSWHVQLGAADAVVLYDDNASGHPGDAAPLEAQFKIFSLGDHENGTVVPLLDSMRVGKGPRVPYSEFVKLSTGWHYVKKAANDSVGVRPLNPEYVKTGKVKLVWSGPKPTAPVQLVVQGSGDYRTAFFDVAGGKEVEVPAAEYTVIWGRIAIGKGPRVQLASIYQGTNKPFTVEAGKVFELKMGGPFTLQFNRRGDENASIDALKVLLNESSGCLLTELHGINLACDVMAAKEADGKGAKPYGKFVRFTDPELVNEGAKKHNSLMQQVACFPMPDGYRNGDLVLGAKLPAAGMKLSLQIKKHPLFGEVKSAWQ